MKHKVNKKNRPDLDKFDRKQKVHSNSRNKESKRRLSIYDEFNDEEDEIDSLYDYDEEDD